MLSGIFEANKCEIHQHNQSTSRVRFEGIAIGQVEVPRLNAVWLFIHVHMFFVLTLIYPDTVLNSDWSDDDNFLGSRVAANHRFMQRDFSVRQMTHF